MNKTGNNKATYKNVKQHLSGDKINRQVDTISNHKFH